MKSIGACLLASAACGCSPVQPYPPFEPPEERPSALDALVGPARWKEYQETDVLRYEIDLTIDPERRFLEGEVRYTIRALRALTEIRLDSVYGGEWSTHFFQEKELLTRQLGDRIFVRLDEEVSAGSVFTLRATLVGVPPDGLFFAENRYGRPCVFTDHFSVRARGWFPCEDHPGDRAYFQLRLAIPHGYDVVCSGALRPTRDLASADWVPEGMRGWEGETLSEIPPYLMAIAVAPYDRIAEKGDARLIPHFIYAEDVELARPSLTHHGEWMRRMEEAFGPYPFAKYCVTQVPTRWGGMENAGNTWVNEALFEQDDHGVGTLAHEFAHQWFGDAIGYADWYDAWLSEGFASYFGPWLHSESGGHSLAHYMVKMRAQWLAAPEGKILPVRWRAYPTPEQALNANTYPKSAWVLHMLRTELGDEVFFRGLRNYYGLFSGSVARTSDLRRVMEEASLRDLGWFFDQWLERPGCPELVIEWTELGAIVDQIQEGEPYQFLLPLRWTGADGEVHEENRRITDRHTLVELEGQPISDGRVDPNAQLLFRPAEESPR